MTAEPPSDNRTSAGKLFAEWLAVVIAVGLLLFGYHHLAVLAAGGEQSWLEPFITEMSAAAIAGVLFFGVWWLVKRFPLRRRRWPERGSLYVLAFVVFAVSFTTLNWGLRSLLFPLAGLGPYDYGKMPLRYFMEAPMQAISFTIMVAAVHGVMRMRRSRERELRSARLERSLADARLRNLQLQLQPHFLFNALNTISATMYRDVRAADKMMERLSDLLRQGLRREPSDEVPLATELELLESYLAIMRARFGERLDVRVEVTPDAQRARVPSLLLQPLVENAIRHGGVERDDRGRVDVRAAREGDVLVLEVEDDGPGSNGPGKISGEGIGLSTTAERLRLLYGDRQRLTAGNGTHGGFRVEVRVPFVTEDVAAP